MNVSSKTICRVVMLSVSLGALAASGQAAANPLLSGYGGPGQGTQVILGGTLLNTPGGGSGAQAAAPAGSELTVPAASSRAARPSAAVKPGRHRTTGRPSATRVSKPAPAGPAHAPAIGLVRVSSSGSGAALGLSGGQLLGVLFVFAALMITFALTRQLTRRTP